MNESIWTVAFLRALAERVLWTAAMAGFTYIGIDSVENGFDIRTLDWGTFGSFAAGGALLSILKGMIANGVTKSGPSTGQTEIVLPTVEGE